MTKFLWPLLGLALVTCSGKKSVGVVGSSQKGDVVQRVTVSGRLAPVRKSVVSAPYAGYVQKLFVKVGDRVKAGDPVVSVRPELRTMGEEVFPLRSPLEGVVVQVLKFEGDAIEATGDNKGIVRIDDLTRLVVQANVPEIDIAKLHAGQEGLIKAAAITEKPFKGVIRSISGAAKQEGNRWDSTGVEFPILIDVLEKDELLKPGMSVLVDLIAKKVEGVVTLRLEYIEKGADGAFVTLENGERRRVELGMQNEEVSEIKSGLKEGERVRQIDFLAGGGGAKPD